MSVSSWAQFNSLGTYGGMGDKVCGGEHLAGVCVNVRLKRRADFIVGDLHDVCQSDGSVFLGEVLELSGVIVVATVEETFSIGDCILEGDGRICRRDVL